MARWFGAENAEDARFVLRKDFDDAAGISRLVLLGITHGLDAQKRAIADARGRHAGTRLARYMNENFRGLAETRLVPFDRRGDEFAVAVTAGDVGERHRRQRSGFGKPLAARFDRALAFQFGEHFFQGDAIAAFDVEGARDLAFADLRRGTAIDLPLSGDKGEDVFARGQRIMFSFGRVQMTLW